MGNMGLFPHSWDPKSSLGSELTVTAITAAIILLTSNFTIINAQQPMMSQPRENENGSTAATIIPTSFEHTNDSFSIQVPDGWLFQDLNNTGSALVEETTRGYGILAQLCPEKQEQRVTSLTTISDSSTNSNSSINTVNCKGSKEVIHIIRYPNLDTRILAAVNATTANNNVTTDNVLTYNLQKLQEVGYRNIHVVNNTDVGLNLTNPITNQTVSIVPAQFVEIIYNTNSAPNETRTGYFISTATNATNPNVGTTKGYTLFYERNSTTATPALTTAGSLPLLSPSVGQVFGSFELMEATEVAQAAASTAGIAERKDDGANDNDDDNDDDNGGRSSRGDRFADDDYDGDDDDGADNDNDNDDDDYDGDDDDGAE